MSNPYAQRLRDLKSKPVHRLKEIGDQWRTPEWLFWAMDFLYGPLVLDLFSDGDNSKCPRYFTAEDNALAQSWVETLDGIGVPGGGAFANPPYSHGRAASGDIPVTGMRNITEKAREEHFQGAKSVWLVKSATAESWWPHSDVSQIIHITGRIGFDLPFWYEPDIEEKNPSGAGFGASILIYDGESRVRKPEEYIHRDFLREIGEPIAERKRPEREKWLNRLDGL